MRSASLKDIFEQKW